MKTFAYVDNYSEGSPFEEGALTPNNMRSGAALDLDKGSKGGSMNSLDGNTAVSGSHHPSTISQAAKEAIVETSAELNLSKINPQATTTITNNSAASIYNDAFNRTYGGNTPGGFDEYIDRSLRMQDLQPVAK
jgi:hypothetical protein